MESSKSHVQKGTLGANGFKEAPHLLFFVIAEFGGNVYVVFSTVSYQLGTS